MARGEFVAAWHVAVIVVVAVAMPPPPPFRLHCMLIGRRDIISIVFATNFTFSVFTDGFFGRTKEHGNPVTVTVPPPKRRRARGGGGGGHTLRYSCTRRPGEWRGSHVGCTPVGRKDIFVNRTQKKKL